MSKPRIVCLWVLLWPLPALAAFAALQIWIISIGDMIFRDTLPGGSHALAPSFVSHVRWSVDSGNGLARVKWLADEQPLILPTLMGIALVMAAVGWVTAVGLSALASMLAGPPQHSNRARDRVRVAARAVSMSWLWGLVFGTAVGGAAWFIGFNRNGASQLSYLGLMPSPLQTAGIVLAWSMVIAITSVAFLRRAAAAMGPSALEQCQKCGYPRAGVPVNQCPECGTEFAEGTPPTAITCHRRVAKWVAGFALIAAGACALTLVLLPAARDWFCLRTSQPYWVFQGVLPPDGKPLTLTCLYGEVTLDAQRLVPQDPAAETTWEVRWRFVPSEAVRERIPEESGTRILLERKMWPGPAGKTEHFPFGELGFVWRPTDKGALVSGLPPVFSAR